jgi:hypothetical protein
VHILEDCRAGRCRLVPDQETAPRRDGS